MGMPLITKCTRVGISKANSNKQCHINGFEACNAYTLLYQKKHNTYTVKSSIAVSDWKILMAHVEDLQWLDMYWYIFRSSPRRANL